MEAVKRVIGLCTALDDDGRVYVYRFFDDGTVTRRELRGVADIVPHEFIDEVTGTVFAFDGDVPEDIKERAKRIV